MRLAWKSPAGQARLLCAAVSVAAVTAALGVLVATPARGGAVGSQVRVSQAGPDGNPAFTALGAKVAYNPQANQSLVIWTADDSTAGALEIFGRFVDGAGNPLGGQFQISDMGPAGDPSFGAFAPAVAYNAQTNEYLVVWAGLDDTPPLVGGEFEIFGQRLTAAGDQVGEDDFRISAMGPDGNAMFDGIRPAVTYNSQANEYLVVWEGDDNTPPLGEGEEEIFGQRLTATGAAIGEDDFRISLMGPDGNTTFDARFPAIAHNPQSSEYLVTWFGDEPPLANDEFEVFGRRLTAAGAPTGADEFRISQTGPDGNPGFDAVQPAVAANTSANEWLVLWTSERDGDNAFEVHGQRLAADGAATGDDDFRVSAMGPEGDPSFDAVQPAVVFNGPANEYFVAWSGDDDTPPHVDQEFEIYGQRLSPAGIQIGEDDFQISQVGPDGNPNFAAGAQTAVTHNSQTNQYLVAWDADDGTPPLVDGEFEVFARRAAAGLIPGRCANPQFGTAAPDVLTGTSGGDNLLGFAGDDAIAGFAGDDCLDGGDGRDRLSGDDGDDALVGGNGNDRKLSGGKGKDSIDGGKGNDGLSGGDGNDKLTGGKGNDSLTGGKGKNSYSGGSGNDKISARNKRKETVDCGKGRKDSAKVDRNDKVKGCEKVRRSK